MTSRAPAPAAGAPGTSRQVASKPAPQHAMPPSQQPRVQPATGAPPPQQPRPTMPPPQQQRPPAAAAGQQPAQRPAAGPPAGVVPGPRPVAGGAPQPQPSNMQIQQRAGQVVPPKVVPVVAAKPVPAPKPDEDDIEENYDYDDDFVDEEEIAKVNVKPVVPVATSLKSAAGGAGVPSIAMPNATQVQQMIAKENQQVSARTIQPGILSPPSATIKPAATIPLSTTTSSSRSYVPLPTKSQIASLSSLSDPAAIARVRRARRILREVSLTVESHDILIMQPQTKYQLFVKDRQRGKVRDVASQYNEDWLTQETSTELTEVYSLGTQAPDDLTQRVASGAGRHEMACGPDGDENTMNGGLSLREYAELSNSNVSSTRLLGFLNASHLVVETLLNEEAANERKRQGIEEDMIPSGFIPSSAASKSPVSSITSSSLTLSLPSIFGPRKIIAIEFSTCVSSLVMVAYGSVDRAVADRKAAEMNESGLSSSSSPDSGSTSSLSSSLLISSPYCDTAYRGLILLYDTSKPHSPPKILLVNGEPTCVTMDAQRPYAVMAGTKEGTVMIWDLREEVEMHRSVSDEVEVNGVMKKTTYILRTPTYSTNETPDESHEACVKSIVSLTDTIPVGSAAGGGGDASSSASGGASTASNFHFTSFDAEGGLFVWTGIDGGGANSIGGGGRGDGGEAGNSLLTARIKLVKIATLMKPRSLLAQSSFTLLSSSSSSSSFTPPSSSSLAPSVLAFTPSNTNEYFIGSSSGRVQRQRRYGVRPSPSEYVQQSSSSAAAVDPAYGEMMDSLTTKTKDAILSIAVHPLHSNYFLVGYSSGIVSLFNIHSSREVRTWYAGMKSEDDGYQSHTSNTMSIQWSSFRASVFLVYDASSQVFLYDLLKNSHRPVATINLAMNEAAHLLRLNHVARGVGFSSNMIALPSSAEESATVEVHALKSTYSQTSEKERDEFLAFLQHIQAIA